MGQDVQEFLRFLSRDAKLPLAAAMGYVKTLSKANLMSLESIAALKKDGLDGIIDNADNRKAIINAAKRKVKNPGKSPAKRKREANDEEEPAGKGKRGAQSKSKDDFEKLITDVETDMKKLEKITITINRAPFMLVFAMVHTVLVHEFSVASALSLSHSYISANAISKGRAIGIIHEKEEESSTLKEMLGGASQPTIKVMGREIAVVRGSQEGEFRAIDFKALKARHVKKGGTEGEDLYNIPTYSPEAAQGYLSRVFGKNLSNVIGACLIALQSWLDGADTDEALETKRVELEKHGYNMYVQCRPDVPYGQAGWGKKGELSLERVLDQRKKSNEEHAEDKRKDMSDEKGKQLSIEEATKDTEVKTDDTSINEDVRDSKEEGKSKAVRKARATNKKAKEKQLALEETMEREHEQ